MPGGRPPKLTAEKERLGNPGQRPLPAPVALRLVPDAAAPAPPPGLRKAGKDAWARLWWLNGRANPKPFLESDAALLVRLCQAYDERDELRRVIRKEGRFSTGSTGQIVSHPAVDQLRTLEALITRWEGLCGLTPLDRGRLGMVTAEAESKLEAFLGRRHAG